MRALLIACVILAIPPATSAATTSLRCGNDLVRVGDSKPAVLAACGEPDFREQSSTTTRGIDDGVVNLTTRVLERWFYDCGANAFMKALVFEGGILRSVEVSDDRGSGPTRCF